MPPSGWFVIGVVAGPFGLTGEVRVHPLTDLPERYERGLRCWIGRAPEEAVEHKAIAVRWHKGNALVRFAGVDDRTSAEALRGLELWLPESERRELPEDTFYDEDLIGLEVYTEDGRLVGTLDRIHHNPANDLYEVAGRLIPAVKQFVVGIDLSARRVTIRLIPGLLED